MTDTDDMWRAIKYLREHVGALEQTVGEAHAEIIEDLRNRVYALEHRGRYVPVSEDDEVWDDES